MHVVDIIASSIMSLALTAVQGSAKCFTRTLACSSQSRSSAAWLHANLPRPDFVKSVGEVSGGLPWGSSHFRLWVRS